MAISPVRQVGLTHEPASLARAGAPPATKGPFAGVIEQLLAKANLQEAQANQAVQDLATGRTENVHNVMLAVAKADLTFRLVLEIRNRLTEALQEILRMQV